MAARRRREAVVFSLLFRWTRHCPVRSIAYCASSARITCRRQAFSDEISMTASNTGRPVPCWRTLQTEHPTADQKLEACLVDSSSSWHPNTEITKASIKTKEGWIQSFCFLFSSSGSVTWFLNQLLFWSDEWMFPLFL